MAKDDPKVSVAIVVSDGAKHATRAIKSVLTQTYKNIELLVIYNGADDDKTFVRILEQFDGKVSYFKKANMSVADCLTFAVKKADGHYFCWLSQDDIYDDDAIRTCVSETAGKDKTVAVANWSLCNSNNRLMHSYVVGNLIETNPSSYLAFAEDAQINTSAMLFPIMLLGLVQFSKGFPAVRDYAMLNALSSCGAKFAVVNQTILKYSAESEDKYIHNPDIHTNQDYIHSDLIAALSFEEVEKYFGDLEKVLLQYKAYLQIGRRRSAAFLIYGVIRGLLDGSRKAEAKEVLLDTLSCLTDDMMAVGAEKLLTKATKKSTKKRLIFSSGHWLTGGMERVMSTLFRELKDDYEIFLITPYEARKSQIDVPQHVVHINVSDENFRRYFDVMILAYGLLFKVDVAIGCMNLFERQLNFYQLCVGTDIKTIASNHEYYFYPYKSAPHVKIVAKRLEAFAQCSAIVWPTNFNAALCGMYVANNYVIGNPNNFDIQPKSSKLPRDKTIIAVGRFDDYVKRVDRIIECFAMVLKKVPDAKLKLVGKLDKDAAIFPGRNDSVSGLMARFGIPAESVEFVGEVNNMPDHYNEARVLLLTSNSEGFGMVLNEAACHGVPSVGNYTPGIEDIIVDGQNGYITEQGDINTMAARTIELLLDDKHAAKLSTNARAYVAQFDAAHIGSRWRTLIDAVLDSNQTKKTSIMKRLTYKEPDQRILSRVLAQELNEIFYHTTSNQQQLVQDGTMLILSKVKRLPSRLKANVEYEGLPKTVQKIATRSYRIARKRLKI